MLIISVKYCCSPCYNCKLWFTLQSGPPRVDCVASQHVIDPPWTSLAGIRPDTICSSLAAHQCSVTASDGVWGCRPCSSLPSWRLSLSLSVSWLLHAGFHHVVPALHSNQGLGWTGENLVERSSGRKYEKLNNNQCYKARLSLFHSTLKPGLQQLSSDRIICN